MGSAEEGPASLGVGKARRTLTLRHRFASSMSNVKDLHHLALDGEEYPICVRLAAVEELPHFKRKTSGLWSKRTTLRK